MLTLPAELRLSDDELALLTESELDTYERLLRAEAADLAMAEPSYAFTALGYHPNPGPQSAFHEAAEYDVLYGGAAGGGKTKALLMDDLRDCMRFPGLRVGAFRRTYDELAESLLKELAAVDFGRALSCGWNGTTRELRFPNGSLVRYRYAETVKHASRRQGGEYQKLTIDERTLIDPEVVDVLAERIRSGNAKVPVIGIRSGTNPGGAGHGAVKQRFVDATERGKQVYTDPQGFTVRFIQAKATDTPQLDASYLRRLDAIPDPHRRAAMRDGDWDSFAGQFFDEWRHATHVVRAFALPSEWRRVAGIDYGYAAPWCVLWAAVDNDRRVWVYREVYRTRVVEREQAAAILTLESGAGERRVVRHADPSMWSKVGEAPSPAMTYRDGGVPLLKAINDRVPGWQRVHTFLQNGSACQLHRAQGLEVCPLLHVFDNCRDLIRTLPSLPADDSRPEDVDTHAEDHAADALRYLLMGLGTEPKRSSVASPGAVRMPVTAAQ